ncbi:U3 small nucleolar RNA-associated protein [Knufia obscura]|uniref:U3 small nucleolar RNA-associated protein n=1 Tax=Knufia obscura TaxID=1635080 RepID=A0ABR0RQV6_9EURO|nr:U3 small nucleolar RNA-associated protein [Knufia obscura]
MDIHRCRFVPYQPRSINALAFSHTSNAKQRTPADLKLALGRENGDIEIWNPARGEWTQERIFRGGVGRTVEQVQWTQDVIVPDNEEQPQKPEDGPLRLFSSGGSSSISEWDLEKGVPKSHADGNTGDIWCFAPQPQWTHNQARNSTTEVQAAPSQLLAAGCADGSIVLFSTVDNELRFDRVLTRPHSKKSRVISITWRDRDTVVAGFEESVIRVIDIRNKQTLRSLNMGKSRDGSKTLAWAVKCLPNGTILSGDSSGELKVWDAQNYSLVQRLKTHNADVMDITTNAAGTMILTCGVDRRTVAYAPQSNTASSKTQRWYEVRHRRFHEHDVKAIASYESKSLSIAVSGGMDTVPVVVPLKNWNEEHHRSLPHLPQKPQMSVSAKARLMLTWWGRDLFVWNLPPRYREPSDQDSVSDEQTSQKLLGQIQLRDEESITSAEISTSGNMVVAATSAGVKLFQIRRTISADGFAEVRSRPIDLPKVMAGHGANTVGFSPDSKWLYAVRPNNVLSIAKIVPASSPKERPTIHDRVIKLDRKKRRVQTVQDSKLGDYSRHISAIAFSSDSRIIAVGDLSGATDTWILEGHESESTLDKATADASSASGSEDDSGSESDSDDETDSRVIHNQKWIRIPSGSQLPSLESAILALSFKPSSAQPEHPSGIHGNEGLHATRHNHHPISPEHPPHEAGFLVAVTANHQVVEFDVLKCRLSEWSRRNPSSLLPDSFKMIKDRVMGIWFDTRPAANTDRLWLYGTNFMYMLDMAQDLVTVSKQDTAMVKVGRLGQHVLEVAPDHALVKTEDGDGEIKSSKKRKRNKSSGAGDEMTERHKYSAKVRRTTGGADDAGMGLLSPPRSPKREDGDQDDDEMDLDDEEQENALVTKRRHIERDEDGEKPEMGPASWHTFQYRGIYGACSLQTQPLPGGDGEGDGDMAPEVVVVERPMYDVELLPRFTSGQEW